MCFMGKDSFILIGTSNSNVMIIKFEKYTWSLLSGFRRQQANGKSVLTLEKQLRTIHVQILTFLH